MDQDNHPYMNIDVYISTTWITIQFQKNIYNYSIKLSKIILQALEELSVLIFTFVEIQTYLPMMSVFCTETEMLLVQKKEDITKVQVNKNIFYFQPSNKPNVDIIGITVSMWKIKHLKPSSLLMMFGTFKMKLKKDVGQETEYTLWRGPAQDVPYDLILWYVSKTIYLS